MHDIDIEAEMALLWLLRHAFGIHGPEYGCGITQCGACTVHIDGLAARACQIAAGELHGAEITTIEGLGTPGALHPVQRAGIEEQVARSGCCRSGQVMQAASLPALNPERTDDEIDAAISGNLCRCAT